MITRRQVVDQWEDLLQAIKSSFSSRAWVNMSINKCLLLCLCVQHKIKKIKVPLKHDAITHVANLSLNFVKEVLHLQLAYHIGTKVMDVVHLLWSQLWLWTMALMP